MFILLGANLMPELPEVETYRSFFNQVALNKNIKKIQVTDIGILRNPDHKEILESNFNDFQFIETKRHGKFLFAKLSDESWISLHFGMSGSLKYRVLEENPHKHDRVLFFFDDEHYLAFKCMRKFGKIEIIKNPTNFIKKHKFGPDSLSITLEEFKGKLSKRKRSIKSALLDQSIIAGVGNLYADEALFQAKIYPNTLVLNLSTDKIDLLLRKIKLILTTAIKCKADYEEFPELYFIHHRKKDGCCPKCQSPLNQMKITQRTTYFCPKCQSM